MQSNSRSAYWLLQCAGWGVYTLAKIFAAVSIAGLPWVRTAAWGISVAGLLMIASRLF